MSIGAISPSNPVTINGLSSAQSQPKAPATGVVNGNGQITGELINTKA